MQPIFQTHWYLSAQTTGHRISAMPQLEQRTDGLQLPANIWVQAAVQFQEIEGIGAAFTEAAASVWCALPEAVQQQVIDSYFAPEGHAYSFCRVHMNSCDFSISNYAHAAVAGDVTLAHFTIDRDRQYLLPMIKAALKAARRPVRILASPWSPPAWMKSNGQMNQGGKLLAQYSPVWAQCYVKFIQAYAAEGVPIWGVSVQNEPDATQTWDSCIYSAQEERDFVRDHLGPALHAAGLGHVRIVIWDHNRDQLVERAGVVYSDPAASEYVWGAGFHWYGENHFDHVRLVHDAWPDKKLLFTEGCQEGGPHHGSWAVGERYAQSMIADFNRWTCGWIDWNLLLNHTGGPNHVGNLCSAPVLASEDMRHVNYQSSFDCIGHFARFVKLGARRILCAATREVLECTAFINTDGSIATVVLNRSDGAQRFTLKIGEARGIDVELPPHSIATFVSCVA
jgi:glucosylceramidase